MSAEGKKKRGFSGLSNAKNIPFRYGGSKCDYSTRIGGSNHPRMAGSKFLVAMIIAAKLNYRGMSDRMYRAAELCMDSCPTASKI